MAPMVVVGPPGLTRDAAAGFHALRGPEGGMAWMGPAGGLGPRGPVGAAACMAESQKPTHSTTGKGGRRSVQYNIKLLTSLDRG